MADRYWRAAADGNWGSTANWSTTPGGAGGASVPTTSDSVFFDRAGSYIVTLSVATQNCLDFTVSAGTVTFADGVCTVLNIAGSLSLVAGTIWSSTAAVLTFTALSGARTITTNGTTLSGSINIGTGAGTSTYSLGSALTVNNTITLSYNTLILNGYNITTSTFSSSNFNTRQITFGTNTITVSTAVACARTDSLIVSGSGGFVGGGITYDFGTSGRTVTNLANLTLISTGSSSLVFAYIANTSYFNNLDLSNYNGYVSTSGGTNTTVNIYNSINIRGSTVNGYSVLSQLYIIVKFSQPGTIYCAADGGSNISGLQFTSTTGSDTVTQSGGNLTLSNNNFTTTPTATFTGGNYNLNGYTLTTGVLASSYSTGNAARAILFGSTGIISLSSSVPAATTVLSMSDLTSWSCTGTPKISITMDVTKTVTFGASAGTSTTFANKISLYVNSGSSTLTITGGFQTIDFTGSTCAALGSPNCKDLVLASGTTLSSFNPSFTEATCTINANGSTTGSINVNSASTTLSLLSNLSCTPSIILTTGTLNLNNFSVTAPIFTSSGTGTRVLAFGTSGSIILSIVSGYAYSSATSVLGMNTLTNFSYTGTSNIISNVTNATYQMTYDVGTSAGGSAATAMNLTANTGNGVAYFAGWYRNLNLTGVTTTPVTSSPTIIGTLTLNPSAGNFSVITPLIVTNASIDGQGKTLSSVTLNTAGITLTLLSAVTINTVTLTQGTLNINGFTLTTNQLSSNNTNTRTITFGAGSIAFPTGSTTPLAMQAMDNFTFTGTGTMTATMGTGAKSFLVGSTSGATLTNVFDLFITSGTAAPSIQTGSSFRKLDFTGCTGTVAAGTIIRANTMILDPGGTYTNITLSNANGNATITSNGKSIAALSLTANYSIILADALTTTATSTMSAGTLNCASFAYVGTQISYTGGTFSNVSSMTLSNQLLVTLASGTLNLPIGGGILYGLMTIAQGAVALTAAATVSSITMSAGTGISSITLNNYNLSTNVFNSTGTSFDCSIAFGTGNIIVTPASAVTVVNMPNVSKFSWTGTGGFVIDNNDYTIGTITYGTTTSSGAGKGINLKIYGYLQLATTIITSGSYFNVLDLSEAYATISAASTPTVTTVSVVTYKARPYGANLGTHYVTASFTTSGYIVGSAGATSEIYGITINGTGITVAITTGNISCNFNTTLTAGTLDLGGFNLSVANIFNASFSTNKAIAFGSTGSISSVNGTANQQVFNMGIGDFFSYTGSGDIYVYTFATCSVVFGTTSGGVFTNALNLKIRSGGGGQSEAITISGWWKSIDFTGYYGTPAASSPRVQTLTLESGGNFSTVTPQFSTNATINGNGGRIAALNQITAGTTITLSSALVVSGTTTLTLGTLALAGFTLTTWIFSSSNTNTRTLSFGTGGSVVLSGASANAVVLNLAQAQPGFFTWTGTGGFVCPMTVAYSFTVGTTASYLADITNAPNLTLPSGTGAATFTSASWFNNVDFTGSTGTPSGSFNCTGLILATGGTYTSITPTLRGTGTVNGNNKTVAALTLNHTGTTTLAGNISTTGSATLTSGALNLAGYILTTGTTFLTGATASATRSISGGGTITVGTAWTATDVTNLSGTDYIINMISASAKTFTGLNGTYGTLNQAGAGILTIAGSNSFRNIIASTRPSQITFTASTTQTVTDFSLSGIVGSLVTMVSSSTGTRYNISDATGTITNNYLSIRDCNATGGATWYAVNSTNVSNNAGWIFGANPNFKPGTQGGAFF